MFACLSLLFCRLTLLAVFCWATVGKAQDVTAFREAVVDFHMLPSSWSRALAWIFLGAECLVVVCLLSGIAPLLVAGFVLAAALLLAFGIALSTTLLRKMHVVCNCFGRTVRYVSVYDVVRNGLLVLCALGGLWFLHLPLPPAPAVAFVVIGCMSLCTAILLSNLADIVDMLRKPLLLQ
ncbi:hypothetical protein KDH_08330 [Dictyobacter sp. S3.2.2.5]|uniref:Methylamine utilisation protein MauE domain-containing protein n=1 Tax=Dictyobacter halimunensis TaxID=3026934 RepID=A0ABQ6FIL6_9CHLR|nr:hypothetical protein KDH_08330 [Dictyobacter sp. S3.2.2.5]